MSIENEVIVTKEEAIEEITEYVTNAPENTGKIQVIILGDGGWLTTKSWKLEED